MLARPQYQGVSLAFLSTFWLGEPFLSAQHLMLMPKSLQCILDQPLAQGPIAMFLHSLWSAFSFSMSVADLNRFRGRERLVSRSASPQVVRVDQLADLSGTLRGVISL